MNSLDAHSRAAVRGLMRERRAALPAGERCLAAEQLAEQVVGWPVFRDADKLAVYVAVGGEMDPMPLAVAALELGKKVFLPILSNDPQPHLVFRPWAPNTPMANNRLGIPEPVEDGTPAQSPDSLDLVFVPLTAADSHGNRLGQGAGYYDRSFGFLKQNEIGQPKLAGLAYPFQLVEHIAPESWDVPLAFIVTPTGIMECVRPA